MATELHTINTVGRKNVPHGTTLQVRLGSIPATMTVSILLPGQTAQKTYENLPIKDGVVLLPVSLSFMCHAKEDHQLVHQLSDRLLQDGFLTWLDSKDLLPGDDWKSEIEDAIERADRVIVFFSEHSVEKTGYRDASLSEEIFHLSRAQAEAKVEPHSVSDDVRRESVAVVAGRTFDHPVTLIVLAST